MRLRNETGEVASWLIVAAALAMAATLASGVLRSTISELASRVADAAGVSAGPAGPDGPTEPSEPETPVDPEAEAAYQERRDAIIEAIEDLTFLEADLDRISELLSEMTPEERERLFASLTDEQLEQLFTSVDFDGPFGLGWEDGDRTDFYEQLYGLSIEQKERIAPYSPFLDSFVEVEKAVDGDAAARAAFDSLVLSDDFRDGPDFEERESILRQAANYPETDSIENLEALTTKEWFQDMDLEDTQRTAKLVAFLTQHQGGDIDINRNTLEQLLGDDATIVFDWDADSGTFGQAGGGRIGLNRDFFDAGHDPADLTNSNTERMIPHTVAHEVNHILNGDAVAPTYEYFMGEYRAFYVGQQARYGRPPTVAEVIDRVDVLINTAPGGGAYASTTAALADPVQGPLIAAFVSEVLGREVTPATAAAEIQGVAEDDSIDAPTPVSVDGGTNNLDNS